MGQGFAPAKINLTLHVTGQRPDGYHLLDSLVVFASAGDTLTMHEGPLGLNVSGPFATGIPSDKRNSILKTAAHCLPNGQAASFHLHKELPSSAGIGGGTADAACTLRLIRDAWPDGPAHAMFEDVSLAATLGADVPVCLSSRSAIMRGIGEQVTPCDTVPTLHAVLVNPRVEVSTPAIFKSMARKDNPPMTQLPNSDFIGWLADQRNDMQDAAIEHAPVIADVLKALSGSDLCRMSGSGATCFGLYPDADAGSIAAQALAKAHPEWWVEPCSLGETRDDIV